ncbi:MAG: hypothetical protein Fur0037_23850 [Planctomycetota bacterium]
MSRPLVAVIAAVAAVLAAWFGVGSYLPDRWHVETTRILAADASAIGAELSDLSRWRGWLGQPFVLGAVTDCRAAGTPGTAGQSLTWRGSKGRVVLAIEALDLAGSLSYELRMRTDRDSFSLGGGRLTWEPQGTGRTLVSWSEHGTFDTLSSRWAGWFGALQEHVREQQQAALGRLASLTSRVGEGR